MTEQEQIESWAKKAAELDDEWQHSLLEKQQLLTEMARVGFFSDFEVWVHTDDPGKIPHFHVWDKNSGGGLFHTCVKILSAEYFHHNGKEDVFNTKQKKELVEFLKAKPKKSKWHPTNWDFVLTTWNSNNSDVDVPEDLEMPDYTKLP